MSVLVTGGAGYIGSHTTIELIKNGYDVVIVDNLSNSHEAVLPIINKLAGTEIPFYLADVRDHDKMSRIFQEKQIEAVIHFAGLKAVGESVSKPIEYYRNNLESTLELLEVMKEYQCHNMIFSSSATVYGAAESLPISEEAGYGITTNPYGTSKLMQEQILIDVAKSDPDFNPVLLRYFNPVGAHPSGKIGEDPQGIPNNLMPYITQVAVGKLEYLNVYGNDYPTPDGTGIRDYIHVMDLADGHVAALKLFERPCGLQIFNLGTGKGYSVLEVVHAFEKVLGRELPYRITDRRAGDIAACYADPAKAEKELGWKAIYTLDDMCRDAWNWQSNNPNGYNEV